MATSIQRLVLLITSIAIILTVVGMAFNWTDATYEEDVIVRENVYMGNFNDLEGQMDDSNLDTNEFGDQIYGDSNQLSKFSVTNIFKGAGEIIMVLKDLGDDSDDVVEETAGLSFRIIFLSILTLLVGLEIYFITWGKKNT